MEGGLAPGSGATEARAAGVLALEAVKTLGLRVEAKEALAPGWEVEEAIEFSYPEQEPVGGPEQVQGPVPTVEPLAPSSGPSMREQEPEKF